MAKTMKKEDVLYRKDVATFDVKEISKISGKPLNNAVKTAIEEAKKATKAGTMKAGEAKIGLIEGHLFLRIKAGSSHEDDFLIAKNFTPPNQDDQPVRDPAYKKKVSDYIEVRTEAYEKLVAGAKALKLELAKLDDLNARALDMVEEAKRGAFGLNNPADRADELVRKAILTTREVERLFTDEVHAPFETHRNFAAPDGVDNVDIAEYSRSYYLTKWRPVYGKAEENRRLAHTALAQIRAAASSARNFADRSDQVGANYESMTTELAALAEREVTAMTQVWGLQPVDGVARAVATDGEKIVGLRTQAKLAEAEREVLTERYLQTANERMVAMKSSYTRLRKHVDKMAELTGQIKTIPKPQLSLALVKEAVKRILAAEKAMTSYVKTAEGHIKAAGTAYAKVKKEAAVA